MTDPKPLPHPNVRYMFGADGKPTQAAFEFLERMVKVTKDANTAIAALQAATATLAPVGAQYVLVANDGTLTADRKLTAGAEIGLTDGGANGNLTIAYTGSRGGNIVGAQGAGTGTTYTRTGLPANKLLLVFLNGLSHNSGSNQNLQVEVSSNGGTNWSTPVVITTGAFAAAASVLGMIAIGADGAGTAYIMSGIVSVGGGAVTIGGGGNVIDAVRLSFTGGNFDAGTVNIVTVN